MGVPATTGQLRTKIEDMKIGDYIACDFNTIVTFSDYVITAIEKTFPTEVPMTGFSGVGQGYFYFVKVAKGLLIGDRVCKNTVTWDMLNTKKHIQGIDITMFGKNNGIIRSLTGGVAYADANGNMSLTDKGFGAFPTNNEWDRYIVNFPTDKIQSGKTLDDVFHWSIRTHTRDTPVNGLATANVGQNTFRVWRGFTTAEEMHSGNTTFTSTNLGFRPVFEFQES